MDFITVSSEELANLRPDPVLWEQELDVRPKTAEAVERAVGIRSGKVYWRSGHDHLYALELGDFGKGRPSTAIVYGHWDRYEPRPPEHEINLDLLDFSKWVAEITPDLDPKTVEKLALAGNNPPAFTWPEGAVARTPDSRFSHLPDFPYEPKYVDIEDLKMAYVESGQGDPVLCLHGEPTWGFLYRKMIPALSEVGRVIVPDQIGFGRSDKPTLPQAYTYKSFVRWMRTFIRSLALERITLVCQDWGGLIGMRVLSEMPDRFSRLVAMNTGLPTGEPAGGAFMAWRKFSQTSKELDISRLMSSTVTTGLTDPEANAYASPFPTKKHQTAALIFPRLVPVRPDHPGAFENRCAKTILEKLDLPVLLAWGEKDTVTRQWEPKLRAVFRHAAAETIENAGHFIQEDAGEEVASLIRRWITEAPHKQA
ncbi:MAG: haloalkane dehalogenase [Desulfobacterales bacterium]